MKKTYVRVESVSLEDGTVIPERLFWQDGREHVIRQVMHTCTASHNEFEGIRYTVIIGSAEKYLYRIGSRWYVDSG